MMENHSERNQIVKMNDKTVMYDIENKNSYIISDNTTGIN